MAKKNLWAGLDVGVATTSLCIINDKGEILRACSCPTVTKDVRHQLAVFRRERFASVILEAGLGIHLARGLRNFGYPVELYETRQLSKFLRVRRNKTDAGDANGIAEAGRIGGAVVSRVYLKDFDNQCLQSLLTIRRRLISQRVSTNNMLGRLFEQFGGHLPRTEACGGIRKATQKEIRRLFKAEPAPLTSEFRYLAEHLETLRNHQAEIDRYLERAAASNEVTHRFQEIPGVGPICALSFYAAVGDPHRFERNTDLGNYFGLTPRIKQSGASLRIGRISKMGNRAVRTLLVQAAVSYLHYCKSETDLSRWAREIEGRRGKLPSRVALARKLAIVMLAMWKSGQHYEPRHSSLTLPSRRSIGFNP